MESIGKMYEQGHGVDKNIHKVLAWYEKATNSGLIISIETLGIIYKGGYDVKQSYEKTAYWYQKGATLGNSSCQQHLEYLYENGLVKRLPESSLIQILNK